MDLLKNTYYNPKYKIATKGRTDFVIHTDIDASHPAGVLFEAKKNLLILNGIPFKSYTNAKANTIRESNKLFLSLQLIDLLKHKREKNYLFYG